MIDAINSLNKLYEQKEKLGNKLFDVDKEIATVQQGRTSIKSLINFKSNKEELLAKYSREKEDHINNIRYIEDIIRIVSNNLEKHIHTFKAQKLNSYYLALQSMATILKSNSENISDLWTSVSEDKNLKKIENI
jgi:hypothetical protein